MRYNPPMSDEATVKIKAFFAKGKMLQFKKGEMIIRAEEQPLGVMYLTEGIVRTYSISTKGEEVVVNLFKPGTFFPMSWALNDKPNKFFFEALTDVKLFRCNRDEAVEFVKANPDVLLDLLKRVYSGLDGVFERMSHVMGEDAYQRLVSELSISVKRFGEKIKEGTYLLHLSEKDLASQTGLTRETVSREMKKLKEKEYVIINKDQTMTVNLSGLINE